MDDQKTETSRRGFLKLAGTSAPAAVAAMAAGSEAVADTAEPEGEGLRKTAHVKAYLETARF
ncbi:MAG: twin-arginine translocation pathway signal protein [Pseudomonadota bacterium]